MIRRPPRSRLLAYTTVFRFLSEGKEGSFGVGEGLLGGLIGDGRLGSGQLELRCELFDLIGGRVLGLIVEALDGRLSEHVLSASTFGAGTADDPWLVEIVLCA